MGFPIVVPVLIIFSLLVLVFGGLPIMLAAFKFSWLILGIVVFIILWKIGLFESLRK